MTRLASDLERRDPLLRRARGEAGAERMPREAGRVDAGGGDALFDNDRHRFAGEPTSGHVAVPIDWPEDGTGLDRRNSEPAVKGEYGTVAGTSEGDTDLSPRAFLIGFRAAQRDDHTLPDALDVRAVEADQL